MAGKSLQVMVAALCETSRRRGFFRAQATTSPGHLGASCRSAPGTKLSRPSAVWPACQPKVGGLLAGG